MAVYAKAIHLSRIKFHIHRATRLCSYLLTECKEYIKLSHISISMFHGHSIRGLIGEFYIRLSGDMSVYIDSRTSRREPKSS